MRTGSPLKKNIRILDRKQVEAGKKVDHDNDLNMEKASTGKQVSGQAQLAKTGMGRSGIDEARLGADERTYQMAHKALDAVPDVRPEKEARIEQLRTMIANGTYKVDANELAKRLLASGLFDKLD